MKTILLALALIFVSLLPATSAERASLWIDTYTGEPVAFDEMVEDLAAAQVVYLGEHHTVERHHQNQLRIVEALIASERELILGIEMMERQLQPHLDKYLAGDLDFAGLAEATDWSERWRNYTDYEACLEAVKAAGGLIVALNADADVIRRVGRGGLEGLSDDKRVRLPKEMNFDEKPYQQLMTLMMGVHGGSHGGSMLRNMFEAQVARDETMAEVLVAAMRSDSGRDKLAVVLTGAGHVSYGYGMPSRVERRLPGVQDRVVRFSESGEVVLPEQIRKWANEIEIKPQQLRDIVDTPIADYLQVTEIKPESGVNQ